MRGHSMRTGLLALAGCGLAALAPAAGQRPAPAPPPSPAAAAPDPRGAEFFEKEVRPLLSAECSGCHSGRRPQGKLDLRSRAALLKGGVLGPAVVPGDPDHSLLVQAVRYDRELKMPPRGRLKPAQVAALTEWVKMGAPWPGKPAAPAAAAAPPGGGASAASHWAFQPLRLPAPPRVRNPAWARSPVDAFVLAELEKRGLKPNPPADRRTLIRRASFDLTGLPPAPEEIREFLADPAPDAFARVVDRLLASPAYGERWGRHWLDVVRYADTNGQDENLVYGNAWRYRDWVVKALNADMPYDEFVRLQIAGDLTPAASGAEADDHLIATGFLVLGPKVLAEPDKPKLAMDIVDEQIDTVGKTFLGLTLGCARCHNHKFDPVPTTDYYALAGIFKSTRTVFNGEGIVSRWNEELLGGAGARAAHAALQRELEGLQDSLKAATTEAAKKEFRDRLDALRKQAEALPRAMAVTEGPVEDVRVHLRGNPLTLGEVVPRGFLTRITPGPGGDGSSRIAFQPGTPAPGASPPAGSRLRDPSGSGRRELADWLTRGGPGDSPHPLLPRVIANRVWQHHFGRGLVGSVDNFGLLGERPTHPGLLEWLAATFAARGGPAPGSPAASPVALRGSLKALHRLVMLSSAYQQSSTLNPAAAAQDPDNRLLWRMNRQRLEVEAIRDAMLAANGTLDHRPGGGGLAGQNGYATNDQSGNVGRYEVQRRSLYLPVIRNALFDMFQVFDFPDPSVVSGQRAATTIAPQALFLLNSPLAREQARRMAERVVAAAPGDPERLGFLYEWALGRPPSPAEIARDRAFLDQVAARLPAAAPAGDARTAAWQQLCQALFVSNEFLYLD